LVKIKGVILFISITSLILFILS